MTTISKLIDAYWDCAYREGVEGRTHDTPNGDAQRIRSQIDAHLSWEARVPDALPVPCCDPPMMDDDDWRRDGYVEGWNACRQAMLSQRGKAES
ncbi:hypothetical protein SAMN04487785_11437 [Dyella jiangningensis]|uniref:hypothetical protein n=1 Tax=Dyella sp. AtDHG13 TaxID=1938897 RepID=UPI00087E2742|nr:hypothetical protein [Dyella sp. AtDHG13]PXV54184.1 hypothetical protein BDW41_113137 [Dyella sp. AtDHG13]SDL04978.1 hypothetical protein SAMN04487785_11437 [Dyella jiangningensis]